jgi:hypothetical protein
MKVSNLSIKSCLLSWLLVISFSYSPRAFALVSEVIRLKRGNQQVVLLADIHNAGTVQQVRNQSNVLYYFLSKFNRDGEQNRFLYELLEAYSLDDNRFTFSEWENPGEGILAYKAKGSLDLIAYDHDANPSADRLFQSVKFEKNFTMKSNNVGNITNIHFLLKSFNKLKHMNLRSIDPRVGLSMRINAGQIQKEDLALGCAFAGKVAIQKFSAAMAQSDLELLNQVEDAMFENDSSTNWRNQFFESRTHFVAAELTESFNESSLLHVSDIGVLADILAHRGIPHVVVFAGAEHIEFLKDMLINQFNFAVVDRAGADVPEIRKNYSDYFDDIDLNGRLPLKKGFLELLEKIREYLIRI